jgi:high-affinity iron transporter
MENLVVTPMLTSLFIILREGFEAMLIVMLIFTYLGRFNQGHLKRNYVWGGIVAGVLGSILIAMAFKYIGGLTHDHEEYFEAVCMLMASGVLGYLAFWCHGAKNHFEQDIQSRLYEPSVTMASSLALSFAVMIAILREGFEIVLFYSALFSSASTDNLSIAVGGIVGLVALLVTYVIMRKGIDRIPTKQVFEYSKYFFIVLAMYFGIGGIQEIIELNLH